MATMRIIFSILWIAIAGGYNVLHRDLLTHHNAETSVKLRDDQNRAKVLKLAQAEIGVTEKTNHNDGERVEAYLAVVGLKSGNPYCAAFVSYIYAKSGFKVPRTAWSPNLFPKARSTEHYIPGNILGIYFPELKRIAHVGIIENLRSDWCSTIEANTNAGGSRNGDGVYRRIRHRRTISQVSDWITPERRIP